MSGTKIAEQEVKFLLHLDGGGHVQTQKNAENDVH